MNRIFLWLDDIRPAPRGFTHVKTIDEAKAIPRDWPCGVRQPRSRPWCVRRVLEGLTPDEWLEKSNYASMPNCPHFGTGYDLVCWMEETGHWPTVYWPTVHSANAAGRRRMEQAIERVQERRAEAGGSSPDRERQPADGLEDPGDPPGSSRSSHVGPGGSESARSRAARNKKIRGHAPLARARACAATTAPERSHAA